MPRGNDKEGQDQALHELGDQFGKGAGNAEELIDAIAAGRSTALDTASLLPQDDDATLDLDFSKLEGPNGEVVVNAAVRGGATVIVYADDEGRLHKTLTGDHEPQPYSGLQAEQARAVAARARAQAERAAKAEAKAEK